MLKNALVVMVMATSAVCLGAAWGTASGAASGEVASFGHNGQQIEFHGPPGTTQVTITGVNEQNRRVTVSYRANRNGRVYTTGHWWKGTVDIRYTVNGSDLDLTDEVPEMQTGDWYRIVAN